MHRTELKQMALVTDWGRAESLQPSRRLRRVMVAALRMSKTSRGSLWQGQAEGEGGGGGRGCRG